MGFKRPKQHFLSEINIVPYIDVMLVLLVIFMLTAPMIHQGVYVDLPKASAQALPQEEEPPIIVTVNATRQLYLNVSDQPSEPIEPAVLALRVGAELKRRPDRKVLVRGDAHADYGAVVSTMVLLQRAGARGIGLITDDSKVNP